MALLGPWLAHMFEGCHLAKLPQVIDIWSAACVSAELILGHPMFPGESGVDQLAIPSDFAGHTKK